MTADTITRMVEEECALSAFIPLAQAIAPYRVTPFERRLRWPYSSEQTELPCWIIADLGPKKAGVTLVYCERGHGTHGDHWGIVGTNEQSIGRDDSWFLRLEDAFIGSGAWTDPLPDHYEVR